MIATVNNRASVGLGYSGGKRKKGKQLALFEGNEDRVGFWLSPPELSYLKEGRWDPCPFPRPAGWDGIKEAWQKPWYANPPFSGVTKWARKAISEGGPGILIMPVPTALAYLVEAKVEMRRLGRVAWLSPDGHRQNRGPEVIAAFLDMDPIERPHVPSSVDALFPIQRRKLAEVCLP